MATSMEWSVCTILCFTYFVSPRYEGTVGRLEAFDEEKTGNRKTYADPPEIVSRSDEEA